MENLQGLIVSIAQFSTPLLCSDFLLLGSSKGNSNMKEVGDSYLVTSCCLNLSDLGNC